MSWIFCVCFDVLPDAFDGVLAGFEGALTDLEGTAVLPFVADVDVVWDCEEEALDWVL